MTSCYNIVISCTIVVKYKSCTFRAPLHPLLDASSDETSLGHCDIVSLSSWPMPHCLVSHCQSQLLANATLFSVNVTLFSANVTLFSLNVTLSVSAPG